MSRSERKNVGPSPALGFAKNMRIVSVEANTPERDVVDIVHNSEDVKDELEIKIENEPEGDLDKEEVKVFQIQTKLKVKVDIE